MTTRTRLLSRSLAVVVCAGVTTGLVAGGTLPALAGEEIPLPHKTAPARTVSAPAPVDGIVVELAPGAGSTVSAATTRAIAGAVQNATGVALGGAAEPITAGLATVPLSRTVSYASAQRAAVAVAALPGVASATPNSVAHIAAAPPVDPSDSYFRTHQNYIWDRREGMVDEIPFPVGGYSTHAPNLWAKTTGSSSVVVAVVDTGITSHGQLSTQLVKGYDFIKDAATARDGNGRDSNPQDQGDWIAGLQASSWHGTHVAGIIAAKRDGKEGVGNAPGVKIQPVRVLGKGGGTYEDIVAGLIWASGGAVSGVPKNATPAEVINMSLGGYGSCPAGLQNQVNYARKRGAVVVVAAGNASESVSTTWPASCKGVVTVAAIDELGQIASYSNYGAGVTLAAPGGDANSGLASILSTWNTGRQTPGTATWGRMDGTSMAAPQVAGAAALLASLGLKGSTIEPLLKKAVSPFPQYTTFPSWNCTTTTCGAGYLDLGRVFAPISTAKVYGTPTVGSTLKGSVDKGFTGRYTGLRYQWFRSGYAVSGATAQTYALTAADLGHTIKVRVRAVGEGSFYTFDAISASTVAVTAAP